MLKIRLRVNILDVHSNSAQCTWLSWKHKLGVCKTCWGQLFQGLWLIGWTEADGSSLRRCLEVEGLSLVLKKIGLVNCKKKKKNQAKATYSNVNSMTRTFRLYQRWQQHLQRVKAIPAGPLSLAVCYQPHLETRRSRMSRALTLSSV